MTVLGAALSSVATLVFVVAGTLLDHVGRELFENCSKSYARIKLILKMCSSDNMACSRCRCHESFC